MFSPLYYAEICILSESHAQQEATCSLLLHPQLADVYGNVFCIRLGRHKTVFVSGWKMVKEAIVTQADNFVDRPYSPMVNRIYSGNSGKWHTPGICSWSTSVLKWSTCLLSLWHQCLVSLLSQQVFSSVMERCGGDSDVLPWQCYEPLVWPRTPWSRASVKRVDIFRRRWRRRKVGENKEKNTNRPTQCTQTEDISPVQVSHLTPCPSWTTLWLTSSAR